MADNSNEKEIDLFDLFRDEFRPAPVKEEVKKDVPADTASDKGGEVLPEIDDSPAIVSAPENSDAGTNDHGSLFDAMNYEDNALIDSADKRDDAWYKNEVLGTDGLPIGIPYYDSPEEKERKLAILRAKLMDGEIDNTPPVGMFMDFEEPNLVSFDEAEEHEAFERPSFDEAPEEVLTGTVVEEYVAPIEGNIVHTTKDTMSAFEKAAAKLEALENVDRELEEETTSMRIAINDAQKLLDKLKSEYARKMDARQAHRKVVHDAKTEVSEEAHKEAERLKAEEIAKSRKHSMLQFHRDIKDLNPEWFKYDYPYDHQWEGASSLALHGSGLLADEMGLGKTLTSIMWLDMIKAKRVLIVTPADTNSNFTLDVSMFAKHRFTVPLASADKAGRNVMWDMVIKPRIDNDEDAVISLNFEQLYSDTAYFNKLLEVKWDAIIIDEFHNAKNTKSILIQRLQDLKYSNIDQNPESPTYGESLVKFLPVTGTFILNKPEDIFTALNLIDSKAFPTMSQFRDFYCEYDYAVGAWGFRPGGERSLLIALGGRIVKRTMAEAGIVLPKQTIHNVIIGFDNDYEDQRRIMRQLAEHSQLILDSERKTTIIEQIALITRQRQAAVWPAGIVIKDPETGEVMFTVGDEVQESIKLDWVIAKIMEKRQATELFPQGERIAVFSQFKTALAALEGELLMRGIKVVRYDGDSTQDTKMKVKRDFDRKHVNIAVKESNGESKGWEFEVVLCNYKTGGVGLNFTHATQLIILDKEWNPGKENQALARTNRIGQTQENEVWIPILAGSIDEWMESLNDRKKQLIAGFDTEVDLQKEFSDFLSTVRDI